MPRRSVVPSCLLLAILVGLVAAWLPAVETAASPAASVASSPTVIRSGTVWIDTKGETIQAHGIGITVTGMEDGCWLGIREVEVFE